jgi:uncharacterized OsmC-like protein
MEIKMKKLIVGLLIAFTMMVSVPISNVFAGGGRGTNPLPEPLGYLLFAAVGATLASVRYWMAKRRCKKDKKIPMTSKMNRTCAFKFLGIEDISRRSPCQ